MKGLSERLFTPQNSFNYIVLAFELLELHLIDADSAVRIDNVNIQISAVRESDTLLLVGSALLFIGGIVRQRL